MRQAGCAVPLLQIARGLCLVQAHAGPQGLIWSKMRHAPRQSRVSFVTHLLLIDGKTVWMRESEALRITWDRPSMAELPAGHMMLSPPVSAAPCCTLQTVASCACAMHLGYMP